MTALLLRLRAVSPAARLALALFCVALVGGGGALFGLSPARARTADLGARREALQGEIAQARAAVANLSRSRLDGVELQQRLELITQQLPAEREIPPLYRRLHDAAASAGLAIALFQPRDARAQDYYTEVPLAVTAEGTYHQLGAFLTRVAELPRVVTVGNFKVTTLERPAASVRAEMTLATYVYRRPGAASAAGTAGAKPPSPGPSLPAAPPASSPRDSTPPAPTTPSPTTIVGGSPTPAALRHPTRDHLAPGYASRGRRDPFAPVPTADIADVAARPRSTIALATLTGIVRGPDGLLALVEMPGGLGYILRTGDGLEEARVIRIGPDSVVFSLPPAADRAAEQVVLALGRPR